MSETRPNPSRKTGCLLNLWILPGDWRQRFFSWLCRLLYGLVFGMTTFRNLDNLERNLFIYGAAPTWWNLGKSVQTENTRVWESQDPIGIIQLGVLSARGKPDYHRLKTMLSKKYWAWMRSRNFGAFTKVKEIVGNVIPQGSVRKETSVVSGMIGITVKKRYDTA